MKPYFTDSELYLIETIVSIDKKNGNTDPDVIREVDSILAKLEKWRDHEHGISKALRALTNLKIYGQSSIDKIDPNSSYKF